MAARKARNTIGIISPGASIPFIGKLIDQLCNQFQSHSYQVLTGFTAGMIEREKSYLKSFTKSCDAILIISLAAEYADIEDAVPSQIPVIFLVNKPDGCTRTCLLESDYSAIYQGIVSCSNLNSQQVACVCSDPQLSTTRECLRAYKNAVSISPDGYDKQLIFATEQPDTFNPAPIISKCSELGCRTIFATSSELTSHLLDYLLYYNTKPSNTPIMLLGYGFTGNDISIQMYIDVIQHPMKEFTDLAFQQTLYLISHPKQKERVFLLKGTLRMHRYNAWVSSLTNDEY